MHRKSFQVSTLISREVDCKKLNLGITTSLANFISGLLFKVSIRVKNTTRSATISQSFWFDLAAQ